MSETPQKEASSGGSPALASPPLRKQSSKEEKSGGADDEVVDEYTDDTDPGYVVLDVTEEEFHRLHKEAMDNITKARAALPEGTEEAFISEVKRQPRVMRFTDGSETGWIQESAPSGSAAGAADPKGGGSVSRRPSTRDNVNSPNRRGTASSKAAAGRQQSLRLSQEQVIKESRAVELRRKIGLTAFNLKVIHEPMRTGFEVEKDFVPERDMVIGGRFQVEEFLGEAAFSTAIQCKDLASDSDSEPESVCLKIIKNNKDYFDQSLDEIKLLHFINSRGEPERYHVLKMIDYFYFKEHLFIVTELLKDNLYEYSRFIRHSGAEPYFTIPRLKKIMKQLLEAVSYIHSLQLIHCDIKPENILIQSYSQVKVKLIDFGSSCFTSDYLNTYVQSRSYRAPEVILGLPYGPKIDLWSLGAVAAELFTGSVLFQNTSVATMLIRMTSVLGPMPVNMLLLGSAVSKYFLSGRMVYERASSTKGTVTIMRAKKTTLKHRLHTDDDVFVDFVASLLRYDQLSRPNALEALRHPFLAESDEALNEVDDFENELRGGSQARSEKGKGKRPPRRLTSTKGKIVSKPSTPRLNNATKKSRLKAGGSTI